MPHAITGEDGNATTENILSAVADESTADDNYEFILWDNGDLTIESPGYQIMGDDTLPHICIPVSAAMKLAEFLGREHVIEILRTFV